MAFPSPHLRVTWFGDAWNSVEEWSTGLRIDGETMPDATQMTALDTAFNALYVNTALGTSGGTRYLGLKVAPQTEDGLYGDGVNSLEKIRVTPTAGPGLVGVPQNTIAATLTTALSRGLANEGRMYLPCTNHKAAVDGRITIVQAEAIRAAMITFLDAVNDVGIGRITVYSRGRKEGGTYGPGAAHAVTGVRIGRVIDTQRRRRNHLAEEYVTGVISPT